ncbi:hypothetical protein ACTOB_006662 [Actinoplanes oblitus]|uniref:Uncharacterized protein n=1 Tax=Actinoplanes oblitus TaxID=3040509 RepID=A0ABY8WBW9_9ACTN|nr:hypothetical protein [Actinoplanes oblitus]WIM94621.1 hypothetical protein ACTOB_006662 [Actinoplanes oblitus]
MHDQMLTLMDDCLSRLSLLRAELAAARCVEPGERRAIALQAVEAAAAFAASATRVVGEPAPVEIFGRAA